MTRAALVAPLVVAAVAAQAAVAPLFPLSGAVVDLPLVLLALLAAFAGPLAAMAALPALALFAGFALNTGPEWLIAAWLPLLPAAAWLQRLRGGARPSAIPLLATVAATGLWARALLTGVAVSAGAAPSPVALLTDLLLPGVLLDGAAFAVAWLACRALGREARSLEPERRGI